MKKLIISWIMILMVSGSVASAWQTYDSIRIDEMDVKADISEYAGVTAAYTLANKEQNQKTITLRFIALPDAAVLFVNEKEIPLSDKTAEISFGPREKKKLYLSYKTPLKNIFNYDINLLANDLHFTDRIAKAHVEYKFPAAYTILETTGKITEESEYTKVSWDETDFPPVFTDSFKAYFAKEKIEINFYKESDKTAAKRGEKINVQIHLKNSGKEMHNLQLRELINGLSFTPETATGTIESSGVITSLTWDIETLKQGEEKIIEYSLTVTEEMETDMEISQSRLIIEDVEMYSNPLKIHIDGKPPIVLCTINSICEPKESYLTCPEDCPSGGEDGYCDEIEDNVCDPDCSKEQDIDCKPEKSNSVYYIILAIILAVLAAFFLYHKAREKKKWKELETKYTKK